MKEKATHEVFEPMRVGFSSVQESHKLCRRIIDPQVGDASIVR
jgi:hypothetical protein